MIQGLDEVLNVGEIEDSQPSMLEVSELVVDDCDETKDHIGCGHTSQTHERFLTNARPWRVADAKEDGLASMSICADDRRWYVRDHPSSYPWEGEQLKKTLCWKQMERFLGDVWKPETKS